MNFFWEVTASINNWIVAHKELVTLIVLPSATWIVTSALSKAAEKRTREANADAAILADIARRAAEERATEARREAEERSASERRLQLELARRMKLADFRQSWINELRDDFAVLLSRSKAEGEVNRCIQSILLRMNPKEDVPKAIFDKMLLLINEKDHKNRDEISFDLTNLVNSYLKSEWEVLKTEMSEYDTLSASQ